MGRVWADRLEIGLSLGRVRVQKENIWTQTFILKKYSNKILVKLVDILLIVILIQNQKITVVERKKRKI